MKDIETDKELTDIHVNGRGFIYNDYSGNGSWGREYNVLHKSSCGHIPKSNIKKPKVFFENENEAINWLEIERKSNWKYCETCMNK